MNKQVVSLAFFVIVLVSTAFTLSNKAEKLSRGPGDTLPFFALKAKAFKGKSVTSSSGVITLTTGTDNDHYQVDSLNKSGYFYVETKIAKFLNKQAKRVPLNICIVIDRSGSMEGVKMGNAKKAAKGIIDLLTPEDVVSVVMYDNNVDSIQIPVNVLDKEAIKKKIDQISARSATNLWGGCAKGYEYVLKNYKEGSINRVLLISDGLANVGLTEPKIIELKVQEFKDNQGITLSTFGVGLDYNEKLMTAMAEKGAGNYYFIDQPSTMASIFARELNGLMEVSAQNAELKIRIPQGVKMIKGYPLQYTESGDEITIKLRDLFSEETKGMVFNFSIANKTNADLEFVTSLDYTDVVDGQKKTLKNRNLITPVKNVDAYLTHFNKPVVEQTILYTANENLENAMAKVDEGDYVGANQFIVRGNKYMKIYARYTDSSVELKKMDSITKAYMVELSSFQGKNADSVKKIQKVNRDLNYKVRQKKQ